MIPIMSNVSILIIIQRMGLTALFKDHTHSGHTSCPQGFRAATMGVIVSVLGQLFFSVSFAGRRRFFFRVHNENS
jgi:hypothetical protein